MSRPVHDDWEGFKLAYELHWVYTHARNGFPLVGVPEWLCFTSDQDVLPDERIRRYRAALAALYAGADDESIKTIMRGEVELP